MDEPRRLLALGTQYLASSEVTKASLPLEHRRSQVDSDHRWQIRRIDEDSIFAFPTKPSTFSVLTGQVAVILQLDLIKPSKKVSQPVDTFPSLSFSDCL